MKNINEMNYRELQEVAKGLGIKANQKADVLRALIIKQQPENFEPNADSIEAEFNAIVSGESASEASATTDADTPVQAASEASRPVHTKAYFEFVKADNCTVTFKQCGVRIIIGWSKKDFKFYIHNDNKGNALYNPYAAIQAFKRFKNGEHGDVARIVAAIKHIYKKPSIIQAMEKRAKEQQNVSAVPRKENESTTKPSHSSFVKIDPEWLKGYREQMKENYDARLVRGAYTAYLEGNVHSGSAAQ